MGIDYRQAIRSIYKLLKITSMRDNERILFYKMIKKNNYFKELTYREYIFYNWDISKDKYK